MKKLTEINDGLSVVAWERKDLRISFLFSFGDWVAQNRVWEECSLEKKEGQWFGKIKAHMRVAEFWN